MKKCLFLIMCFSFFQLYGSINWTTPTQISNPGVDVQDSQVVMDSNGNATAVWLENGVIQSSFQPFGGSWSAPVAVTSTGTATSPRTSVDGSGNVTAVWLKAGKIYTSIYNGSSWSAALLLSDIVGGATAPSVAVDSAGNTIVAWARNGFIEAITKSSNIWGLVYMLSVAGSDSPEVAISNSGLAIVVWHSAISSVDTIVSATSSVGGVWNVAQNITATNVSAIDPKVTVDGFGNATAIWFQFDRPIGPYVDVQVFASTLFNNINSPSWTDPIALSDPGIRNPDDLTLRIKSNSKGDVLALWSISYDGTTFNIESSSKQVGGTWSHGISLALLSYYAFAGDIGVSSLGDAIMACMFSNQFNTSDVSIMTQTSTLGGFFKDHWSFPTFITYGPVNGFPRVAAATIGNQVNTAIVWLTFDGANKQLQAITGSYAVIEPPLNLQLTQQVNNLGVFSDYYNTLSWEASPAPDIQSYVIYRNGLFYMRHEDLSSLQIVDHNDLAGGPVTYGVAALDRTQNQSATATISLP